VARGTPGLARPRKPGAVPQPARRPLSVKAVHDIITAIATRAGLDDDVSAHVLRHTFATTLVRGGTDLVIVARVTRPCPT